MSVVTLNKTKYLSDAQYKKVVEDCKICLPDIRAVFVLFVAYTGARRVEIARLSKTDVSDDSVFVKGVKGSLDREIPMPEDLIKIFRSLPGDRPFDRGSTTLDRWWDYFKPRGTKGLHMLRHTMAIRLYKKTNDIRLVKYLLGHKSITNTMVYADYCYSQNELREALL